MRMPGTRANTLRTWAWHQEWGYRVPQHICADYTEFQVSLNLKASWPKKTRLRNRIRDAVNRMPVDLYELFQALSPDWAGTWDELFDCVDTLL